MNYKKFFRQLKLPALALAILALAAAPSFGQTTVDLAAISRFPARIYSLRWIHYWKDVTFPRSNIRAWVAVSSGSQVMNPTERPK